jgi:hypothetical protein
MPLKFQYTNGRISCGATWACPFAATPTTHISGKNIDFTNFKDLPPARLSHISFFGEKVQRIMPN